MPTRKPKITVNLPLYDALWKLHPRIKRRFPGEWPSQEGVNALGVMFGRPSGLRTGYTGGYWNTPTNTATFASTGSDGNHFGFLVLNSRIDADSPIVLTAPCSGGANRILARNFQTFLRMGLRRGFFAMEQFAYDPKPALHVYGTPDWEPTEKWHCSVGFVPEERQKGVLAFVARELNLKPFCYTPNRSQICNAAGCPSYRCQMNTTK